MHAPSARSDLPLTARAPLFPPAPCSNAELCAKWHLEERPVEIKGRGVFPTQPIPAGELIIKFEGPVYDKTTMSEEKDFSEAIQVRPPVCARASARAPRSPRAHAHALLPPALPFPAPAPAPRRPPSPPPPRPRRWASMGGCGRAAAWTTS